MSRANTSVEQACVLQRIEGLMRNARGATALVVASLALGGTLAAAEALFDAPIAAATALKTRTKHHGRQKTVQEFVKVKASDAGGIGIGFQPNTFAFTEKCKANGRPVVRKVVYSEPDQPLGKCDLGSRVTVIERQPLQGEWVHRSGVKEGPITATYRNNHHFKFIEQAVGTSGSTPTPPPPPPPPPPGKPYESGNVGVDISWPQCNTTDETPAGFDFGIVGVTYGLGYSTNPCLATEADNFPGDELNLYVNTGWNSASSHVNPDSPHACVTGDENCLAYNYGYNAGIYAVNAAAGAGINVNNRWWLDVESDATWSADTTQNRNSLQGEFDALIANGATEVGAYSTTVQWNDITGTWHNNWASWGATTWTTAGDAMTYCQGHQFTGSSGPSELMQYLPGGIDHDVAC